MPPEHTHVSDGSYDIYMSDYLVLHVLAVHVLIGVVNEERQAIEAFFGRHKVMKVNLHK